MILALWSMLFCIILSIANMVQESQLFFQLAKHIFFFLKTPLDKQRLGFSFWATFSFSPEKKKSQRKRM